MSRALTDTPMDLELFYSPYCGRCKAARRHLQKFLSAAGDSGLNYRERDVIKDLDRAVEVGVTATPALVIDGKLVATGSWRPEQLRTLIEREVKP